MDQKGSFKDLLSRVSNFYLPWKGGVLRVSIRFLAGVTGLVFDKLLDFFITDPHDFVGLNVC